MNPRITTRALSTLALAAALAAALPAQAQNIAIVNGKPVPKARVDALTTQITKQAAARGQQLPPDLDRLVRDKVVLDEMFVQEAEKRGLAGSADYKAQMEIARQNILVEKEEDAKALITQIKGGAKFEELAQKNSKDPGSGANGGDLDFAAPSAYVPEFSQAMVKLKKGEMTETPVKSQFGYHIIKLEDTRDAQFPPLEEVKGQIQQRLAQQKVAAFRDEIRAKAKTDYKFTNQ